ncbi:MAG: cation:proton antiporter [Rhodocyclaceae bacterium]
MSAPFAHILILLATSVAAVMVFQRLRMPSSLGYLLVGALVGPHAFALVPDSEHTRALAEFGIVFLLFTIGLNFSLPQILAMRNLVFALGTSQVAFTTLAVGFAAWLVGGHPAAAAFVIGAVVAQSSTTIISKQLAEQGEDQSRHGRLGLAMSVFQDVTAVPFVVVIPVLGATAAGSAIAMPLALALLKAVLAFALVFLAGRWLLRPLFHEVASRRSAEVFTLTVLLVTLIAAGITQALGLSMALGAFLAGMMLGDTEFRHQIESTIRPFRDVLVGLFFVTIGMLLDVSVLPQIWHLALIGAVVLLAVKATLVAVIVQLARVNKPTAVRTGLVLAVGGEFGFALLAIALGNAVVSTELAQLVLTAVLFSMILAPFLIRHNRWLSNRLVRSPAADIEGLPLAIKADLHLADHVIICGYGRIGQNVGRFLEDEGIRFAALDMDPARVRDAHAAGMPLFYGDSSERDILEAVGAPRARLLVVAHDDLGAARKVLHHVRDQAWPTKVMVRTRDETPAAELIALGATEVVPEILEASMMIASHALLLAGVPPKRVLRQIRNTQANRYALLQELYRSDEPVPGNADEDLAAERLHSVEIMEGAEAVGHRLADLELAGCRIQARVSGGVRETSPDRDVRLCAGDTIVLFGTPEDINHAQAALIRPAAGDATTAQQ